MLKIHSVVLIMTLGLLITATLFSIQQTYMAMGQTTTATTKMSSSSPTSQNQTKRIIMNDMLMTRLLADSLANRLNKTAGYT